MPLFPNVELEPVVQVGDRTRLLASKSYGSKGSTITKVEIEPNTGDGYIDVSGSPVNPKDWFTDWQYPTAGTKTISVKLNGGTVTETIATKTLTVITAADDMLFASDADLIQEEPEILKWVKAGRNSYNDVHREAQKQIIDLLNRKGYRTIDGAAITKAAVKDLTQVREMAKYLALHLIFEGLSNTVGDVYSAKSQEYRSAYTEVSDRQVLGLDLNQDDAVDAGEGVYLSTARMIRR